MSRASRRTAGSRPPSGRHRRQFLHLVLVMTAVTLTVAAIAIVALYRVTIGVRRDALVDIAHGRAALLESMAEHSSPIEEVLPLVWEAQTMAPGLGRSGELMMGRRSGAHIEFLVRERSGQSSHPLPVPFRGPLAEPMQHALSGETGTMIGRDYQGRRVMAAYEPIHGTGWGLVAKMDVAEVRAPFYRVGGVAGWATLLLVSLGAFLFVRLSEPISHEIEASERRFRGSFDQAAVGMAQVAPDGTFLRLNQRFCDIVGYDHDEMIALTFQQITHPADLDADLAQVQRLLDGESKTYSMEKRYIRKDGATEWINLTASLVRDARGAPEYFVAVIEDITERVRAQRELLAEKDFSEAMLTSLPGVAYLIDADLRFRRWNTNFETVTGYSAAEIAELSPLDLFGESDGQRVAERIAEVFASGQSAVEAGFRAKDGTTTPHFFTGRRIEIGGSPFLIGMGLDISARVEAEQALATLNTELERRIAVRTAELAASERSYRIVADNTYDWEYWQMPDGSFRYVSPSCERITGYPASEFIADPAFLDRIVHPDDREQFAAHCATAVGGITGELDFRIVRSDGGIRWIGHACQSVHDEEGGWQGVRASNRDITESKEAAQSVIDLNRELSKTVDKLAAANKELEAFSYSVSHDLRAPLRSIDGFSRILLEDHADGLSQEGQRYLGIVRDSTVKMGRLIDELLAFSRLGRREVRRETTAVAPLVREVIQDLAVELDGRNVEWTFGELRPCHADPQLLEVVLTNLIGNALKFTRRRDPARIEVGCRTSEGETVYFVKDNGAGFDMRYADKLFGVFQRLHREEDFPGTGVGLANCRRIITRHGGRIWAEAEPDRGATFSFTIGARST